MRWLLLKVRLQGAASTAPSPGDLLDQPQLGALAPSGPAARATSSSPGENVGSGSPGAGGEDDAPSTSGQAPGVHTDGELLKHSDADVVSPVGLQAAFRLMLYLRIKSLLGHEQANRFNSKSCALWSCSGMTARMLAIVNLYHMHFVTGHNTLFMLQLCSMLC